MEKGLDVWRRLSKSINARLCTDEVEPITESIARVEKAVPVNEDKGYNPYDSGSFRALGRPGD